jgi:hypothetical protein
MDNKKQPGFQQQKDFKASHSEDDRRRTKAVGLQVRKSKTKNTRMGFKDFADRAAHLVVFFSFFLALFPFLHPG